MGSWPGLSQRQNDSEQRFTTTFPVKKWTYVVWIHCYTFSIFNPNITLIVAYPVMSVFLNPLYHYLLHWCCIILSYRLSWLYSLFIVYFIPYYWWFHHHKINHLWFYKYHVLGSKSHHISYIWEHYKVHLWDVFPY